MLRAGEYKGVFGRDLMFCIVTCLDIVTMLLLSQSESDDDEFQSVRETGVTDYAPTERRGLLP